LFDPPSKAHHRLNQNLGLSCEHFCLVADHRSKDMFPQLLRRSRSARPVTFTVAAAILASGLCGCQTAATPDVTGSLGEKAETNRVADSRRDVEVYRDRFHANPKDADAALQYGQALRAAGQRSQAVAVLEQATIAHSSNKALLAGYGRALADNGNFQKAFDVLSRAHTPDNPNWRILSVQGTVLDQLGRYEEARQYYASALKIVPEEPTVLSNLGLSYVLSKDLPKAEETLRRAYRSAGADARVRQNLALVVGLQGRFAEAESIVKGDLPAEEAAANVLYLKQLLHRKQNARTDAGNLPASAVTGLD
jgi:Flp pilus assembly protein TadD